MKAWWWLPRVVRLAIPLVAFQLALGSVFRVVFWLLFRNPVEPIPSAEIWRAFHLGGKFDLRLAIILCLPLLVLGGLPWLDPWRWRGVRILWQIYLTFAAVLSLFGYFVDLGHFGYLETRMNAAVLQYIEDPLVTARMMWETYPAVWGLLALIIVTGGTYLGARALCGTRAFAERSSLAGWRRALAATAGAVLVIAGLYGKLSYYPLRWSDAYFSTNAFVSNLAQNPLLLFLDTLKNRRQSFESAKVTEAYDRVAAYLGVPHPDEATLNYTRHERPAGMVGGRRVNVVVILLESFATFKIGCFGNPMAPTPAFDALARDGVLFRRFYTPSHGTARSVFTFVTGIPDVEINETSSRNPLAVKQHTIINDFEGYEKLYFLGGSATWGNVRGLLTGNIAGLRLYEEGDYASPRVDVWGISDLHLFEEANRVLREIKDRPFFAVIHTSGHHRPYTLPADNRGFQVVEQNETALRKAGFVSLPEYNAFRFLDHSLGFYFSTARNEEYFNNTVFVMFGDHGLPGSAAHLPYGTAELALVRFQVPLLIYAPALLGAGRTLDTVGSEIDVLPTVASVAGVPHRNTTLGRDLFDERFSGSRYAFTMTDQFRVPEIGLLSEGFYLRMPRDGGAATLHDLQAKDPTADVAASFPEQASARKTTCRDLYETARYMVVHNR
jgi:phosphoglycerol transferase MdoB-like AlkP superfamily enzyme